MKYFKIEEFESPDLKGSGVNMDKDFLDLLDKAREDAGVPFVITSGYRTQKHNKAVGGVEGSAHTKGLAADIRVLSGITRFKIISSLIKVGFKRIGVAKGFIHCDLDSTKPQEVAWIY
jgi:uncharacterized protein YcbK (DUF882 family)